MLNQLVTPVTPDTFENEVLSAEGPVLVYYSADWCGPCKMLKPRILEFAYDNRHIKVVNFDAGPHADAARERGVSSLPTLHLFHKGVNVASASGPLALMQIKPHLQQFTQPA